MKHERYKQYGHDDRKEDFTLYCRLSRADEVHCRSQVIGRTAAANLNSYWAVDSRFLTVFWAGVSSKRRGLAAGSRQIVHWSFGRATLRFDTTARFEISRGFGRSLASAAQPGNPINGPTQVTSGNTRRPSGRAVLPTGATWRRRASRAGPCRRDRPRPGRRTSHNSRISSGAARAQIRDVRRSFVALPPDSAGIPLNSWSVEGGRD